jgi:prepilin-type N-terminal cleavage/methylation domain-containing protein
MSSSIQHAEFIAPNSCCHPRGRPFCASSIRPSGRPCGRNAFTLIELLVVIAIISLLVSILLPSLNKAKDLARSAMCAANLRSWGTTYGLYSAENDGRLLVYAYALAGAKWWLHWSYLYPTYAETDYGMMNRCPGITNQDAYYLQYGINAELFMWSNSPAGGDSDYFMGIEQLNPQAYIMVDAQIGKGQGSAYGHFEEFRHQDNANYLFPGGDVQRLSIPVGVVDSRRDVTELYEAWY